MLQAVILGQFRMKFIYLFLLIALIGMVSAVPQPPHTFYGEVIVNDIVLQQGHSSYEVTAEVEGVEVDSYTIGDLESNNYAIEIILDSDCNVGICEGDDAYLFVNGESVDENPLTIGPVGQFTEANIHLTMEQDPEPISSTGGGTIIEPEPMTQSAEDEIIEIESLIENSSLINNVVNESQPQLITEPEVENSGLEVEEQQSDSTIESQARSPVLIFAVIIGVIILLVIIILVGRGAKK